MGPVKVCHSGTEGVVAGDTAGRYLLVQTLDPVTLPTFHVSKGNNQDDPFLHLINDGER